MSKPDGLIVIMGPTASGKSAMALELARQYGGEIVSADSMQLYRDLPVGTAQPTAAERKLVPHHLVGIFDLDVRSDVYTYCELAERAVADILARGKVPVVVGGTGLYLRALLYGLDPLPGDAALKRELDRQYDDPGRLSELRARLEELGDGAVTAKFGNNRRRLVRALEVRLLTGRSILELQAAQENRLRRPLALARKLEWPPELLKERIARRTEEMLRAGWIEEARRVLARGLLETPTAHQALGYRLIGQYLAGEFSRDELKERIVTATWQYARRQRTWFRHNHPEAEAWPMGDCP